MDRSKRQTKTNNDKVVFQPLLRVVPLEDLHTPRVLTTPTLGDVASRRLPEPGKRTKTSSEVLVPLGRGVCQSFVVSK